MRNYYQLDCILFIIGPFAGAGTVDSAKQNLASSFVNGLINCGFGCDKLLAPDPYKWFYKNKDQGVMTEGVSSLFYLS